MDRPFNNSIHQTVSSTSSAVAATAAATTAMVAVSSSSSSSGSFCICGRGFLGDMIACENAHCSIEWFHFECVGLTDAVVVRNVSYLQLKCVFLKQFLIIICYYFSYYYHYNYSCYYCYDCFVGSACWYVVLCGLQGREVYATNIKACPGISF